MSNAIALKSRLARAAVVFALAASSVTCAAGQPSSAPADPRDAGVPLPSAYYAPIDRLLVAVNGEIREVDVTGRARQRTWQRAPRTAASTVLRLRVDAQRGRLWILELGAVHVVDLASRRVIRSVTLPNWMYAEHESTCLPDLQLDRSGAAFVTDNTQPKLWRVDGESFAVLERRVSLDAYRGLDIGFTALAIAPSGAMYAATAAPGLLWRIDTRAYTAENVPLSAPIRGACGLEVRGAAEPTLSVLLAAPGRFEVKRITVAASKALVDSTPVASVRGPASLVERGGSLYLALQDGLGAALRPRDAEAPRFALKAIYRVQ